MADGVAWLAELTKILHLPDVVMTLCRVAVATLAGMRITSLAALLAILFTAAVSIRAAQPADRPVPSSGARTIPLGDSEVTTVTTYCAGCHNGMMRSPSGALLDQFDPAAIAEHPEAWSRAYRQLQAGAMPPAGASRPDQATAIRLLASIDAALGGTASVKSDSTSQEIATRLATMLWDGAPDAELLNDVQRNRLAQPEVLDHQVKRMLADARADEFVSRFFFPWLGLDQLDKQNPAAANFPDWDVTLRDAMSTETRLFIRSQLQDDRDPIALWNADYTFLNEALARHYGVSGVNGTQFRRVALSRPERYGLLGQASILMVTSRHSDKPAYTSPAARSTWIRNHYLGAAPPQPFPGALPVKPELPITPQTRTLAAQPCRQCHDNFFPLGYALENFDPIGRWRTQDQAGPVDSSGFYVDGTPMAGAVDLRNVLLRYPDAFRTTIAEKLLIYAAGKPVSGSRGTADTFVRARQALHAAPTPHWSSIIAAVARTNPPVTETAAR